MEIRSYLDIVRRWFWLVILSAAIAGAGAYLFSNQQTPIYETTSTALLDPTNQILNDVPNAGQVQQMERLLYTYRELLLQRDLRQTVLAEYGKPVDTLDITIRLVPATALMRLSVQSESPEAAAFVANRLPLLLSEQQAERQRTAMTASRQRAQAALERTETAMIEAQRLLSRLDSDDPSETQSYAAQQAQLVLLQTQYQNELQSLSALDIRAEQSMGLFSLVEEARVPRTPISPVILLNTLLATVIGAIFALGVIFALEYLDDRIKDTTNIEQALGVSPLAHVAHVDKGVREKPLLTLDSRSGIAEAFRMLRTNVRFAQVDERLHTILVTSAAPGEGKSFTAANLAVVLAQAGHNTLLVDADLRRPQVHKNFQLPNKQGLTSVLIDRDQSIAQYLQPSPVSGLQILTSGPIPPNPSELLGSHRMHEVLEELSQLAEYVILDSSPVLAVADSSILASYVSGILLVVRAGSTHQNAARRAVEQLRAAQGNILGTLVNDVRPRQDGYYYYYYYGDRSGGKATGVAGRLRSLLTSLLAFRRG